MRRFARSRALIRALLGLSIALPVWCLGIALFALGLALSPWGTGLLLDEGAKRGFYQFESVEGAPFDRLVLQGLRLQAGPADVAIDRLELAWAEDCLLRGRLCIDKLAVEGARVRLAGSEQAAAVESGSAGEGPGEITLPLPVEIRDLALADVDVRLADGTRVRFDDFTSGGEAEGDSFELSPTRLTGLDLTLPQSPGGRLALVEVDRGVPRLTASAIDASIAAQSPLPAATATEVTTPLAERERLALPTITMPLNVAVPELIVEDITLTGPIDYRIRRIGLALSASGHTLEVSPLEVTSRDIDARLSARVELRDEYPLDARLETDLWLPERYPELAGERLALELGGSLAALDAELTARGPVDAELRAQFDVLDPTLPFTASLDSSLLQWPLPPRTSVAEATPRDDQPGAAAPYLAEDVALHLEGDLLHYRAALSLQLEGPQIPRTRVALSGNGDRSQFAWTPLSLALGPASAVSRGRVAWEDGLDVEANLRFDDVDPGRFIDGGHGQLSGDLQASFHQTAGGWQVNVPDVAIEGELAERALSLRARLKGDSDMRWAIERFDFRQADNRLSASGEVAETALDLRGEIDMPELGTLHESLAGSLSGEFAASGSLETPRLELAVDGDGLAYADNRVASLRLAGEASGLEDTAFDVELGVDDVAVGGQRLESVALNLEGRLSEHRLTLDVTGDEGQPVSAVALRLSGALGADRQRYRGTLDPLNLASEYGDVVLEEALAFEVDLARAESRVEPFCLRRERGGRLCLDEPMTASAERGRAALSLRDLPMDLVEPRLPEAWQVEGQTDLSLIAEWRRGGVEWQARADLASRLALQGEDAYGQPWELPPSRLDATLEADPTRADLDLTLELAESGNVSLDLGIAEPLEEGRLEGELRLDALQLSRYRTLVVGIETLEGSLDGAVSIAGTRHTPALDGQMGLSDLQVSGVDVPLVVRDGEVNVDFAGDSARIEGFVAAEEGRLTIAGDAAWPAPDDWRVAVDLDATAEPLQMALQGVGRLRVAPDVQVRVTPSLLQVRGQVQVPWARLEVGQRPASAVGPSPDEVIISEREDERRREAERAAEEGAGTGTALNEAGMAVDVRIDLNLGPDMILEAYGLSSGLDGALEVRQQNGPVQLFGDVNLTDGRFRAFGQDLLIRQGALLFSGPPDQPLLDFEAIRNPEVTEDGVVAGLRVEGFAAAPNLSIFSEPAMDEARALSYLLRGRAPRDGDTDGALTSALVGLTVGQTGGAVGAIGEAFGIGDLSLETAGGGEDSQVVVSGYLTDDLRISYGVGIFSPIAELALRYTLWRNLYLEAISGAAQAVDLVYAFSRPGEPPIIEPSR
ncbi:translocation/assembly module TamB domain-containing protein [Billgrantia gudaonensis]|uniref:Translocation and assembly module TamB n=1 Tax=Billgrantia gudaonensis TaxID=376427 RepID=A0A1G8SHP3_9GAMM|nr:translocation/assembly module TamB domain-containing protein [Halomonas gudaonensis]SDJ28762.1 translocation and assembly module TamB [Halomonas gudaonensis]